MCWMLSRESEWSVIIEYGGSISHFNQSEWNPSSCTKVYVWSITIIINQLKPFVPEWWWDRQGGCTSIMDTQRKNKISSRTQTEQTRTEQTNKLLRLFLSSHPSRFPSPIHESQQKKRRKKNKSHWAQDEKPIFPWSKRKDTRQGRVSASSRDEYWWFDLV